MKSRRAALALQRTARAATSQMPWHGRCIAAAADRSVTVDGNRLTLLPEGPERLAALIGLIDGARNQSLRLLYYIYRADRSGDWSRARWSARSTAASRSLADRRFRQQHHAPTIISPLSPRGATFCRFHPSWGRRYLLRNHQKLALADGDRRKAGC
jgi:cardiolipin synthase